MNGMHPKDWLQRDLDFAPPQLVASLREYYRRLNMELSPVLNTATSVDFQYADSDDYIFRDIGYASVIMKTLLDFKITGGFTNRIDSIVNRIVHIDKFIGVDHGGLFYEILSRQTYKRSIVVGLKKDADCISDIEYIELRYDNKTDVIPFSRPIEKKFAIRTKITGVPLQLKDCENQVVNRTAVKIRLCLKPTPANYLINKESLNCINSVNFSNKYSRFDTMKPGEISDYLLNSTEHHLTAYHEDVDGLVLAFMDINRDRLSAKLGYTVTDVDKNILHIIDMALF
jgi:hypothetical protein